MQQHRAVANDHEDELQEKWARKRKDMELTREQNYRFKKLVSTLPAHAEAILVIHDLLGISFYLGPPRLTVMAVQTDPGGRQGARGEQKEGSERG